MKKWVIGSFVGAIIIFGWQFLSWSLLGIHNGQAKYLPQQDAVLNALSSNIQEDGMYMLPSVAPDADSKAEQDLMESMAGKPYASVVYIKSYTGGMARPMIVGFVIDLALVVLLISILTRAGIPSFIGILTGSVAVALFSFLWGPYMAHNWFQMPWEAIQGHLIDAVVAWGLCGAWLGWWLRRPA